MNIDQYFALHVTSADAKVAYRTYTQERANVESMLEDLLAAGDQAVSAGYLRDALMLVMRAQAAQLEAVATLVMQR